MIERQWEEFIQGRTYLALLLDLVKESVMSLANICSRISVVVLLNFLRVEDQMIPMCHSNPHASVYQRRIAEANSFPPLQLNLYIRIVLKKCRFPCRYAVEATTL